MCVRLCVSVYDYVYQCVPGTHAMEYYFLVYMFVYVYVCVCVRVCVFLYLCVSVNTGPAQCGSDFVRGCCWSGCNIQSFSFCILIILVLRVVILILHVV